MNRLLMLIACALFSLGAPATASAQRVAEAEQVPLDFRRTTLVVRDIDASLAFYRDALGMAVTYDNYIRTPREATTDEGAERSLRLVLLRSNDVYVGQIGLMQYFKPDRPERPERSDTELRPGDIVLVFNVKDQESVFARASTAAGVTVGEAPHLVTYPGYGGQGVIRVNFASVYDPDGHYIELNQVLDALPGGN
jgi:catechol 2,3-dioxygenase-like lactoylglutathione lyase family enzyme